jgi:hypothetical protein
MAGRVAEWEREVCAVIAVSDAAHGALGRDPVPAAAFMAVALSGARNATRVPCNALRAFLARAPLNVSHLRTAIATADVAALLALHPQHAFLRSLALCWPAQPEQAAGRLLAAAPAGLPCLRTLDVAEPARAVFVAACAATLRALLLRSSEFALSVFDGDRLTSVQLWFDELHSVQHDWATGLVSHLEDSDLADIGAVVGKHRRLRQLVLAVDGDADAAALGALVAGACACPTLRRLVVCFDAPEWRPARVRVRAAVVRVNDDHCEPQFSVSKVWRCETPDGHGGQRDEVDGLLLTKAA